MPNKIKPARGPAKGRRRNQWKRARLYGTLRRICTTALFAIIERAPPGLGHFFDVASASFEIVLPL